MSDKIGVAINSCGMVAYEHAKAYLRDPRCEIADAPDMRGLS